MRVSRRFLAGACFSRGVVFLTAALTVAGCSSGSNSTPVTQTTPTITWATPAAIVYGTALSSTQLDATANTPGSFSYSPAAGTVPVTGSQKLSVTFTPTDTTNYTTASASVTLMVNQATPTITWAAPAAIPYGTALSAVQLDAVANTAGSFSYSPSIGQVLPVGSQTLSVTFTPADTVDYATATASVTITVSKPATAISWTTPAPITYGTALSSAQLDATANVPGSFSYSPAAGTVLTAGPQTLSVAFTPTDTANYASATGSVTLMVNQATPTITWVTPASVVQGTALSSTQLDATANVPGSFSYSPDSGSVMNAPGTQTLTTTFTPQNTTNYTTATSKVSLIVTPSPNTAMVDFGTTEQTIRGFGGSTAWMPEMSSAQASALFGQGSNEVGLSILRVRIDPSSVTGSESNWGTELGNALEAQALGATVFATPWTPPSAWKSSSASVPYNSGKPLWGGYLNPAHYADYANYLESFVTFMKNGGVDLYGISMQNEPDENVAYESCVWTGAQMDTWVAQNASVLTTKLIMPESATFNTGYSDPALNDPKAVGNIGIIAGHLYGTTPSYYANAESKGREVWMTEHYLSPTGAQPGIADALAAALEIHNSLTVGQYNAYVWWWALDWNAGAGVTNDGLVDTTNQPNFYGYAMAQFSRFVRPGYVRVSATASPVKGVYLSAYTGNSHSVIVAINTNTSATSLPIYIENQTVTTLTPYQTTAAGGLSQLSPVTVSSDYFTYSLPAQSITTFVQ